MAGARDYALKAIKRTIAREAYDDVNDIYFSSFPPIFVYILLSDVSLDAANKLLDIRGP